MEEGAVLACDGRLIVKTRGEWDKGCLGFRMGHP